jgi:hypothetical protein
MCAPVALPAAVPSSLANGHKTCMPSSQCAAVVSMRKRRCYLHPSTGGAIKAPTTALEPDQRLKHKGPFCEGFSRRPSWSSCAWAASGNGHPSRDSVHVADSRLAHCLLVLLVLVLLLLFCRADGITDQHTSSPACLQPLAERPAISCKTPCCCHGPRLACHWRRRLLPLTGLVDDTRPQTSQRDGDNSLGRAEEPPERPREYLDIWLMK